MADTLQLSIPASARTLLGFVGWCHSPSFPEQGRIDYLAGDLEVDMSPEDLYTHGAVKAAIAARLQLLIADSDLGTVFVDRARVTSPLADLSVEPDVVVVLWDTIEAGRVKEVPAASGAADRYVELRGGPDLVVEIVSDASVGKDRNRLPELYARAGSCKVTITSIPGARVPKNVQIGRKNGMTRSVGADWGPQILRKSLNRRSACDWRQQ